LRLKHLFHSWLIDRDGSLGGRRARVDDGVIGESKLRGLAAKLNEASEILSHPLRAVPEPRRDHRDVIANLILVHLNRGAELGQKVPLGRKANADHVGSAHGEGRLEGQVLNHAAVHQREPVELLGAEEPRHCNRCADRLNERAVIDEYGRFCRDVGGHSREPDWQVFDEAVVTHPRNGLSQTLGVQQAKSRGHRERAKVAPTGRSHEVR